MSIEAAAVVWPDGTFRLHEPEGRNSVHVPDTQSLWDLAFENRGCLEGIAHTHPGSGYPSPSGMDVTTFAAMEKGLGRRLSWWILSSDRSVLVERRGDGYDVVERIDPSSEPGWMSALRAASFREDAAGA